MRSHLHPLTTVARDVFATVHVFLALYCSVEFGWSSCFLRPISARVMVKKQESAHMTLKLYIAYCNRIFLTGSKSVQNITLQLLLKLRRFIKFNNYVSSEEDRNREKKET